MTRLRNALLWSTLTVLASLCACTPLTPNLGCERTTLMPEQLIGTWMVSISGQSSPWTLELQAHPEHQGSLRGELIHKGQQFSVVADMDDAAFTMEETQDGQRISATWLGTLKTGHCDQLIAGERRAEGTQTTQHFVIYSNRHR